MTKQSLVEKHLDSGQTLRVGQAFDFHHINTTELRSIVCRLRKEYLAYGNSYTIKTLPIKGKSYCEYKLVKA